MEDEGQAILFEELADHPNTVSQGSEPVLFGSDPAPCLLAVEEVWDGVVLYFREEDGSVRSEVQAFHPWLLTDEQVELQDVEWEALQTSAGDGGAWCFRWLVRFENWEAFEQGRRELRERHAELIAYRSAARQYLMITGRTLFKGMAYHDLHRLQLDLETTGLDPNPEPNRILMIALSDNRGYEEAITGSEPDILKELVKRIQELNPDVIEGHNLFGFDIPYLLARAQRCRVPLSLGRDGSPVTRGSERNCPIGANNRAFFPCYVQGRHLLDTYLAVQRYDVARGMMERYGLKESAAALGISSENRIRLEGASMSELWEQDPETVKRYSLQDVYETRMLAEITLPTEFYQTQMIPDSFQNVAVTGTGEKVNLLFLRAYLHARQAIPKQQSPREYPGGYTEVRKIGLIHHIVKADVESLYPSLMLVYGIKPAADTLNVFLPALRELTRRRLDAKTKAKQTQGAEAAYWDGLQASFKILINSFYGYLGAPFNFNDYDAAEQVTLRGQEIVKTIAAEIERLGGSVVEIDTDGVYFQPPEGIETEEQEEAFIQQVGSQLPEGIRLAHDGRYEKMLSLKAKNYVLLDYEGKKTFKGASLRSRADEPFGRAFLSKAVDGLLAGKPEEVAAEYRRVIAALRAGEIPVEQLCRRERVTDKSQRADHRLYELARRFKVGDYIDVYQQKGNRGQRKSDSLGLLVDYDKENDDVDYEHYVDKLYKFANRLRDLFDDFDALFPKPTPPTDQMNLFDA